MIIPAQILNRRLQDVALNIGVQMDNLVMIVKFTGIPDFDLSQQVSFRWATTDVGEVSGGDVVLLQREEDGWSFVVTENITQFAGREIFAYLQVLSTGNRRWHSESMQVTVAGLPDLDGVITPPNITAIDQMLAKMHDFQETLDAAEEILSEIGPITERIQGYAEQTAADRAATEGYMQRASDSASHVDSVAAQIITDEATRVANENVRKTQETARQANTAAAINNANQAADNARDTIDDITADIAATVLDVAASRWDAIAAGNPIAFFPAPGSNVQVTGDRAGTVWAGGINLFNPINVISASIDATGLIISSSTSRMVYIECLPNQTYTISRIAGQRFVWGCTTGTPAGQMYLIQAFTNHTASSATITTPANAKYLVAYVYYSTVDTDVTPQQILDSIQIELGAVVSRREPYRGSVHTITPGTPINIKAVEEVNHLIASAGTLTVRYNRDSNDMLKQFAREVTDTADVAQLHGLINHQPLGIIARAVAGFSGPEGGPSPELRWTIAPVSQIDINAQGTNLFRAGDMKSSGLTRTGDDLSRTATPNGTYYYSQKNITGLVPYGTYTIRSDTSNSAGFVNATDIMLRTQRNGVLAAPARTVTYEKGQELIIVYYDNLSNTAAIGVTYTSYWKNIQLTLGTIAPPFEPFSGTTKSIAFAEPLYGEPDLPNIINITTGQVQIQADGKVMDGTEAWTENTQGTYKMYELAISGKNIKTKGRCTHFPSVEIYSTNATIGYSANNTTGALRLRPDPTKIPDVAALKTYLAAEKAAGTPVVCTFGIDKTFTIPPMEFPSQGGTDTAFTNAGGLTTLTGLQGLSGALAAQDAKISELLTVVNKLLPGGTP